MNNARSITRTIFLDASPRDVWDALTNPEKTKQFMFNCEVSADWDVGGRISWKGNYLGYESGERGIILACDEQRHLKYTSFDPNFGLPDVTENHLHISYQLSRKAGGTELITTIENFNNDPNRIVHISKGWDGVVLPSIKLLFNNEE